MAESSAYGSNQAPKPESKPTQAPSSPNTQEPCSVPACPVPDLSKIFLEGDAKKAILSSKFKFNRLAYRINQELSEDRENSDIRDAISSIDGSFGKYKQGYFETLDTYFGKLISTSATNFDSEISKTQQNIEQLRTRLETLKRALNEERPKKKETDLPFGEQVEQAIIKIYEGKDSEYGGQSFNYYKKIDYLENDKWEKHEEILAVKIDKEGCKNCVGFKNCYDYEAIRKKNYKTCLDYYLTTFVDDVTKLFNELQALYTAADDVFENREPKISTTYDKFKTILAHKLKFEEVWLYVQHILKDEREYEETLKSNFLNWIESVYRHYYHYKQHLLKEAAETKARNDYAAAENAFVDATKNTKLKDDLKNNFLKKVQEHILETDIEDILNETGKVSCEG